MYITLLILATIAIPAVPQISLAQFSGTSFQQTNPSSLILSPRYPEPNELVKVTLNDYSVNTNGSTIAWFIDGEEQTAARNNRELSFTAKKLGEETQIVARTSLPNGTTLTAQQTVRPIRLDILVEADSSTPYFYKGRAVPALGGSVQVTALPFIGEDRDPESFSYKWQVGSKVEGGGSRFGKNTITFAAGFERQTLIFVDVFDTNGILLTSESIYIPLAQPELYFYEVNPLRGLSEIAINKNFIFIGDEIKVRAEPFFIDNALFRNNPFQEWKLNSSKISNPSDDQQEITLRRTGETGSFTLEYHVRNLKQLLQGVKKSVTINF